MRGRHCSCETNENLTAENGGVKEVTKCVGKYSSGNNKIINILMRIYKYSKILKYMLKICSSVRLKLCVIYVIHI